ncbi:Uncharacterised protein [Pseudomonas fluorescens]|jgi:hypothetical protein|uniref:Uncharacterized protein n=1 Tax=Pseudomonas fluorescens TaxID=294 RepID=A0A379IGD2_PSEFL|nr:hypothetical protein [Pseudomonas fluorescens]SUD31834.1 Uncharacterised protein [Pseudomonas fluorescens]
MTLYESILLEVRNSSLSEPFEIQELTSERRRVMCSIEQKLVEKFRIGFEFFMETTIRTAIANYAQDEQTGAGGFNVEQGAEAKYLRVKPGVYKVKVLKRTE